MPCDITVFVELFERHGVDLDSVLILAFLTEPSSMRRWTNTVVVGVVSGVDVMQVRKCLVQVVEEVAVNKPTLELNRPTDKARSHVRVLVRLCLALTS